MADDREVIGVRKIEERDLEILARGGGRKEILFLRYSASRRTDTDGKAVHCEVVYGELTEVYPTKIKMTNLINDQKILKIPFEDGEILELVNSLSARERMEIETPYRFGGWETQIYVVETSKKD